jgi:outer membrane lipoprotein-sorting protein
MQAEAKDKKEEVKVKKAKIIVDKMLSNNGGSSKINSIKSYKIDGIRSVISGGKEVKEKFTVWWEAPNKFYAEFHYAQKVTSGFDGKTAWAFNPYMGSKQAVIIDREQQLFIQELQAVLHPKINDYKKSNLKIKFDDNYELADGKDYNRVRSTNADNSQEDFYFDMVSSQLYKHSFDTKDFDNNRVAVELLFKEWQKINGINLPKFVVRKENGFDKKGYELNDVQLNIPIDKSKFAYPAKDSVFFTK